MKSSISIKERDQNSCALLKTKQNKKTELLTDRLAKEHTALKALQGVLLPALQKERGCGREARMLCHLENILGSADVKMLILK